MQLARTVSRTAASIENDIGYILYIIEPRKHPVAYFALQDSRFVVTGGSALERIPHPALVNNVVVVHGGIQLNTPRHAITQPHQAFYELIRMR